MLSEEGPGVCSQLLDCQGFLASNSFNSLPPPPNNHPAIQHTSPHTCDIQNRCDLPLRLPVWGEGFCIAVAVAVATEAVMVVMMEAEVAMVLVVRTNTLCRSSRCGSVG